MMDGNAHAVAHGPQQSSAPRLGDGLSAHCPAAAVGLIVTQGQRAMKHNREDWLIAIDVYELIP